MLPICKTYNAIGIFRYLLSCRHHAAYKEDLLEQFWPQTQPNRAAHSLHVAMSGLRQYLNLAADSYVLFDHGQYMLNPAAIIEDDCHVFEELCDQAEHAWRIGDLGLAQHAYAGVIACYQGDYALGDPDLPWTIARRERLRVCYLSALDHLGRVFVKHEHFQAAVDCYRRLLQCDEYREDAYYQVMRCYSQLGRRAEALRQYERCAAVLAQDLGLEPMMELRDLYHALLADHQPSLRRGRRDEP
jgi:DNA-binding SARP family transcriptional activator